MFRVNPQPFFRVLILPALLLVVNATFAQSAAALQIPIIDADFFQGEIPRGSNYASMTYLDYRYDFAIERSTRSASVKVKLKMFVEPNGKKSFLDRSKLNDASMDDLVEHEQGHINLGYYIAHQVESALNAVNYTLNYKAEIRQNYLKAYRSYEKLQLAYDEDTEHGADRSAQLRWNRNIAALLKEIQ